MGSVHNIIWHNLWPLVRRIECGWVSAHSICPRPIKVSDKCTTLGHIVENVRLLQVPKDDILFMKEIHLQTDVLQDESRNRCLGAAKGISWPQSITTMYRPPPTRPQKCSLGEN